MSHLGGVTGIQGAEARAAAEHPTVPRTAPTATTRKIRLKMAVVPTIAIRATHLTGKGPVFQIKKLGLREAV